MSRSPRPEPHDLDADLALLVGAARADEALGARVRERNLRSAAGGEATLAGVLLDLAERDDDIVVRTQAGRTLQGGIVVVGADMIAIRAGSGQVTYVPARAISSVRRRSREVRHRGAAVPDGSRHPPVTTTFAVTVAALALERPRVALAVTGEPALLNGELRSAGVDLVTVQLDGDPPVLAYLALASLSEVVILASG